MSLCETLSNDGHGSASVSLNNGRRAFLLSAMALPLVAAAMPAWAQKVSVAATKRKIELVNELYLLNARLLAEAGALVIGYKPEESRALLLGAVDDVNHHLTVLKEGEPETGMEREHSVAIKFVLTDLMATWDKFGVHVARFAEMVEIPLTELETLIADSTEFTGGVKELVDIVYEVYGEVIFTVEELRAVTLLAHERAHVEEMIEFMIFATAFPDKKAEYMAKLVEMGDVFAQTLDVLIRNGATFGVAPPPSPEALAALELVEQNWKPKHELILKIAANGIIKTEELDEFFAKSRPVLDELDAAMKAINAALPRE